MSGARPAWVRRGWVRPLVVVALMVLASPARAQDLPGAPTNPLAEAQADAERYPQDYATVARLATVAAGQQRWDVALGAWEGAYALSGGNLDSSLGRVLALLGAGRATEARAAAKDATDRHPDADLAWATRAWTLRQHQAGLPGTWGLGGARAAYRKALALRPDDSYRCGLAFVDLQRGDRAAALAAFSALPADPCSAAGLQASRPDWRVYGSLTFAGLAYQDHADDTGGASLIVQGGARIAELVHVELTGRFLWKDFAEDATTRYQQQELWGRVGVSHAGFGGEVLAGAIGGSLSTGGRFVIGGQGWVTSGATMRIGGAVGDWSDGTSGQLQAGLLIPVLARLGLDVRGGLSAWQADAGTSAGPLGWGGASAELDLDPVQLTVGGWGGPRVRPVDFDEPSVWNVLERPVAGFDLEASVRLGSLLGLHAGYQVLRLDPLDGSTHPHTHVITFGVHAQGGGALP